MEIILASRSPRRRELLSEIFPDFKVISYDVDETVEPGLDVRSATELIAIRKGRVVKDFIGNDALIVSSDTLVELDGVPLGKPETPDHAIAMLHNLSGRAHNVHTGVAVHYHGRMLSATATSQVTFRELSNEEIISYVDSGEPLDKAGSYGIQGKGGAFVSGYTGEFNTIVGLPVELTRTLCEEIMKENND